MHGRVLRLAHAAGRRWQGGGSGGGNAWGGYGIAAARADAVQASQYALAEEETAAWVKPGDRAAEKYKRFLKEERVRVPTQHPDTVKALEAEARHAARELKLALEEPRSLEPYDPPPGPHAAVRTLAAEGVDWARLVAPRLPVGNLLPQEAPRGKRGSARARRYKRYQRALEDFKAGREMAKVAKLQRVVAAGLATEEDYTRELRRLGLDAERHALPFKPRAYNRRRGADTIRGFLTGPRSDDQRRQQQPQGSKALESVVLGSEEARKEWTSLQERLGAVLAGGRKVDAGSFGPLRDPMHFEALRNVHVRREAFRNAYGCDPVPPAAVAEVNSSVLGTLFASFHGGEPLLAEELPGGPDPLALSKRSFEAFWAAMAARKQPAEAPAAEVAADGGRPPATRVEWLAQRGQSWQDQQRELARLEQRKADREIAEAPDYEIVYSPGDMGIRPEKTKFSLHPAARRQYIVEPSG
ncbi:hypothetical protein DIPPA_32464 [Diplonema papillatum]|nr:hypothetical protein DIPPA_32464 [Diplonema papillatum]